jgi:C-terminal processing protease CtpA/Prc
MQRVALVLLVWLAFLANAHAEKLPGKTERVVATARAWAKVKFFHPYLAYKNIDWDAAFLQTLPKVESATTIDEYRSAVAGMLGVLKDPVTGIARIFPDPPAVTGEWLAVDKDVAVIDLARYATAPKPDVAIAALAKAKGAVIDVRGTMPWISTSAIDGFLAALPAIARWPESRHLEHHGFVPQEGTASGGYETVFVTSGARPPTKAPASGPSHVVFVVDEATSLPPVAVALRAAGRATIVSSAPLIEERNVLTTAVELGGGLVVDIRLAESAWGAPVADVITKGDLRARAIAIARRAPPAPRVTTRSLPSYNPRAEVDYAKDALPARPLRVLAAVRIWATLAHFNPYQYLVTDWDRAFIDALAAVDAATDARGYLNAMKAFAVRAGDGHDNVWLRGAPRAMADISTRMIGAQLVVTAVPPTLAKQLAIGDVIEHVDGVATDKALAALRPFVAGSTDEARTQGTARELLVGDPGSKVVLGVRGAKGPVRTVTLVREANRTPPPPAAPWKKLGGDIGYVDLRRLTVPDVDPMLAELHGMKAIVFDMRGYPKGTAWALAPRLNKLGAEFGAQFLQPNVMLGGEATSRTSRRFFQPIAKLDGVQPYRGKVVVLIDDRAISQAEHTCLFLKETAGATFVGSPTAGANGDVTTIVLPGGLRMWFTGQEVRHVDGRQLQKVGVVPDITIRPTLAGVRAGKDEVLDRALAWISTGK